MKNSIPILRHSHAICLRVIFLSLVGIFVAGKIEAAPVAEFTVSSNSVCVGQSILFTDLSSGTITSYSWSFGSGATPSTGNTAGPYSVSYSSTGAKTISLTVTGPSGTNTMTKTAFVIVGADRVKIMSYNLLDYPDNSDPVADTSFRNPYFRTIVNSIAPDILLVQEMNSQAGVDGFLSNVLNAASASYSSGTFINGSDSDNGIFFKSSEFTFVANTRIRTELRDISEFKLVHNLSGDTLRVYSVHLKASTGSVNEAQRARETDSLLKVTNALPAGSNFIVCGDFNIYKSSESAYIKLTQGNGGGNGYFFDPVSLTGTWNDTLKRAYHTQSTRVSVLADGGASGGLNDRFDLMLYSDAVNQSGGVSYVPASLVAYGNDGAHYNDSINQMPNTAVSAQIANALYYASDHIPITESFDFQLNNCQLSDAGALSLQNPPLAICPSLNRTLQVRIKNYGTTAINLSVNHIDVNLQIILPSSVVKNFVKTLSSGSIAVGATLDVTFDSTLNMTSPGNYVFNSNTVFSPDANASNNSMPATTVVVGQTTTTTITPSGPTSFCTGNSVTLNAAGGNNYSWSNGATTQSIVVTQSGSYSVSLTDLSGCLATSSATNVVVSHFESAFTVFSEDMGSVGTTTTIASHEASNGFENDNLFMSGTADVRNTTVSSGYDSASGGANIFITNSPTGRFFTIDSINTSSLKNLSLSFGVFKSTNASNGSDLLIQYSSDGTTFNPISFSSLPTGTGSSGWYYETVSIPVSNIPVLRIQFKQTGSLPQFRLDDISIVGIIDTPFIAAQGATFFCSGGSVGLIASPAQSYLWSNGLTSQNISATNSGNYSVVETSANGCTAQSNIIPVTANVCSVNINVKSFIEGFYIGGGSMRAVSNPISHPGDCDTLILQLANNISPFNIIYSDTTILHTNGMAQFDFPAAISGGSYYFVLRHRNALQTWSASSVSVSNNMTYDFSDVITKAFGSNMRSLSDGRFALWSGDPNNSGSITTTDFDLIENSAMFFLAGYSPEDINGDGVVESDDYSVVENNLGKMVLRP